MCVGLSLGWLTSAGRHGCKRIYYDCIPCMCMYIRCLFMLHVYRCGAALSTCSRCHWSSTTTSPPTAIYTPHRPLVSGRFRHGKGEDVRAEGHRAGMQCYYYYLQYILILLICVHMYIYTTVLQHPNRCGADEHCPAHLSSISS